MDFCAIVSDKIICWEVGEMEDYAKSSCEKNWRAVFSRFQLTNAGKIIRSKGKPYVCSHTSMRISMCDSRLVAKTFRSSNQMSKQSRNFKLI